ncbi:MAG: carbohydrate kinase family protein [Candidatus Nanoarchaeia archaeon]
MKLDIVSFGSAVLDVFVNTDVAERERKISYPVGSKILVKGLKEDIGGGGTNTAVAFSRLGFKTGYIGKLGNDNQGKNILKLLKQEGVKFLGKLVEGDTGRSIILDSKEHNRTILTYKGVNNHLDKQDMKQFKTKWLYFSSLLGKSFETQQWLAEKLFGKTKLAFNPSSYLIKEKKKQVLILLKLTEILILNKEEAEMLVGKSNLLEKLHKLGPRVVVITNKDKKVYAYDGFKQYDVNPHKINVKERTGAGDAFAAGFVAGQVAGKSITDSLKLGLEEGESVLRYFGAKNNLLKRKLK